VASLRHTGLVAKLWTETIEAHRNAVRGRLIRSRVSRPPRLINLSAGFARR